MEKRTGIYIQPARCKVPGTLPIPMTTWFYAEGKVIDIPYFPVDSEVYRVLMSQGLKAACKVAGIAYK